ncbi:MAG: 3-dehydroquinate synthase [Pseudomonadota bacterium]
MTSIERLGVDLGDRSYEILVGDTLLADAGHLISPHLKQPKVFIVTDQNVAELYLAHLERALDDAGITYKAFVLPAGEQSKSFDCLQGLLARLFDAKAERRDCLIALGGGVIGDITGFAAAIMQRGMDFIQVPTTLLAQVDSSVGGKTGINVPQGKNLVGAFHQPRLVLADSSILATLPHRQLLAGYSEVVKYGLINQPDFFTWLESHGLSLLEGNPDAVRHAVLTSCRAKGDIVAEDERESGKRALLNLGHTFGHAIEADTGYGDAVLHGEAVAIGIVLAFDLSVQLGLCPSEDAARVRRHFGSVGLSTAVDAQGWIWDSQRLFEHMTRDKKVRDGRVTFVLVEGIGKAFLKADVPEAEVKKALNTFGGPSSSQ